MKDYISLLRIELTNSFRAGRTRFLQFDSKNQTRRRATAAANVIMVFLGLAAMLAVLGIMISTFSTVSAALGVAPYLLSILLTAGQLFVIMFGMQSVLSNTFFSKDAEFLASLPVKPGVVYAVKMTIIYINEFLTGAALMLPMLISFAVGTVRGGVQLPVYFYLMIPVILITLPVVPLVLLSVISFPMIKIISYFKNRSAATLIVSALFFGALMALYMLFIPNIEKFMTAEGQAQFLTERFASIIADIGGALWYTKAFAFALMGQRFWINMLIFACTVAGAAGIAAFAASVLYSRALLKSGEETAKKETTARAPKVLGMKKTLFLREFRLLMRSQSFALNSILGSIITPIIIVVMTLMGGSQMVSGTATGGQAMSAMATDFSGAGMIILYTLLLLCGINYASTLAFSREGSTFYVLKYLPVRFKDIVQAKLLLAWLISLCGVILTVIICATVVKMSYINLIPLAISLLIYTFAFEYWGIYRDLRRPNVNWTTPYEVIKKNFYPMVPMFLTMIMGVAALFCTMLLSKYENAINLGLAIGLFWAVFGLLSIVMTLVVHIMMKRHGEEYFDRVSFNA